MVPKEKAIYMPSSREPTHADRKLGFCFSAFVQRISRASRPPREFELLIMHLTLEFGGGLELLCESVKIHEVDVNPKSGEDKLIMRDLLAWIKANIIKERPEMFMKGDSVRPGVLVLVNDCDWELSGNLDTALEEKDAVVFISTLHGG